MGPKKSPEKNSGSADKVDQMVSGWFPQAIAAGETLLKTGKFSQDDPEHDASYYASKELTPEELRTKFDKVVLDLEREADGAMNTPPAGDFVKARAMYKMIVDMHALVPSETYDSSKLKVFEQKLKGIDAYIKEEKVKNGNSQSRNDMAGDMFA
jgi:hypothetical protein